MCGALTSSRTYAGLSGCSHKQSKRGLTAARAYGKGPDRPVFQLHDKLQLTLEDVRDAYETCSLIPAPDERAQCYSVYGLDGSRMANYYETVLKLEEELQSNSSAVSSGFWDDPDDNNWSLWGNKPAVSSD